MENRHGLAVAGRISKAGGKAERWASEAMLAITRKLARRRITVGDARMLRKHEALPRHSTEIPVVRETLRDFAHWHAARAAKSATPEPSARSRLK